MDDNAVGGPHPDLRQVVAKALRAQVEAEARLPPEQPPPPEYRLTQAPAADGITIRCQGTWRAVHTMNPNLNGADFSAVVAQFEHDGQLFSYFVEAVRQPGSDTWRPMGYSGGRIPQARRDKAGGFMFGSGSHVCVGGLGAVPSGGSIRVTLADDSVYESTAAEGCCIVFAPVTTPSDHATVQFLNADGGELGVNRVWLGDRTPPRRGEN